MNKHVSDLIVEIEFVTSELPVEDWKDLDLLEWLLQVRMDGLADLWAMRSELEDEARKMKRKGK